MKPAIVADEMFPEGAGPYMDLEEVSRFYFICKQTEAQYNFMYSCRLEARQDY